MRQGRRSHLRGGSASRASTPTSRSASAISRFAASGPATTAARAPDFDTFAAGYAEGRAQVISASLVADLETPVSALLKLADPGSPTVIQDREGASALYVLMPMRV